MAGVFLKLANDFQCVIIERSIITRASFLTIAPNYLLIHLCTCLESRAHQQKLAGHGEAGRRKAGTGEAGTGKAGTEEAGTGEACTGEAGTGEAGTGKAGTGDSTTWEAAMMPTANKVSKMRENRAILNAGFHATLLVTIFSVKSRANAPRVMKQDSLGL